MNSSFFNSLKNAPRKHKLLTKAIEKTLPKLYETDGVPCEEKTIHIKLFSPYTGWTWYGAEYDPEEKLFFGWVQGDFPEWGYFSLEELDELGCIVERDLYFTPCKAKELRNYID